jgi:hypothetical protein
MNNDNLDQFPLDRKLSGSRAGMDTGHEQKSLSTAEIKFWLMPCSAHILLTLFTELS